MKAVIAIPGAPPCLVFHTGREGLSVKVTTYCGNKINASHGVYQVVDSRKVCTECDERRKQAETEAAAE